MLKLGRDERIPDEEVVFYDGILYLIMEPDLKCSMVNGRYKTVLEYRMGEVDEIFLDAQYDNPLSLKDIKELFPDVKLVYFEEALNSWLYQYGNHNPDEWELVGEGIGYA